MFTRTLPHGEDRIGFLLRQDPKSAARRATRARSSTTGGSTLPAGRTGAAPSRAKRQNRIPCRRLHQCRVHRGQRRCARTMTRRRATYKPGAGLLFVDKDRLLFLKHIEHAPLEALFAAASDDRPLRSLAAAVVNADFDVPPFVFIEQGQDLREMVFGTIELSVESHWVCWRLLSLEARMEPWQQNEEQVGRRRVGIPMRRRRRLCGWCGRCAPSWAPITARSGESRTSWVSASSRCASGSARPTSTTVMRRAPRRRTGGGSGSWSRRTASCAARTRS